MKSYECACVSMASPIGALYAAVEGKKVLYLSFTCKSVKAFREEVSRSLAGKVRFSSTPEEGLLCELHEYFEGKRKRFTYSPVLPNCTQFQEKVLRAARQIPYGETRTYAFLAKQAGSPAAARAAGQVMAANPVPILIPCHRVVASSGKLGGFAGGLRALDLKKRLLDLEAAGAEMRLRNHNLKR